MANSNEAVSSLDLQKAHVFGHHNTDALDQVLLEVPGSTYYIQTYGCQMNVSDTEIVCSLLDDAGFKKTTDENSADIVLINTCAIRDGAENTIRNRLRNMTGERKAAALVGVLGCMAERLKSKLLEEEKIVDLIAGPDAYRDLPHLIKLVQGGERAMNVQLSLDETYADVKPVRTSKSNVSAWCSIMRGCNNMCTYCIVPFTRGRERSRPFESILDEVRALSDNGCKEVTLLGQNVNSYWHQLETERGAAARFSNLYKLRQGDGHRFTDLLDAITLIDPEMRVRYTSPHPKDFPKPLLQLHAERDNLCNQLHMPAQSGSSSAYLTLIDNARNIISGENSSNEHADTLSLMEIVGFEQAYIERERTHAYHKMKDNIPEETKQRRLREIIEVFTRQATKRALSEIGQFHLVLVEGNSRRAVSASGLEQLTGRTDTNKRCVFENIPCNNSNNNNIDEKIINYDNSVFLNNTTNNNNNNDSKIINSSSSSSSSSVFLNNTTNDNNSVFLNNTTNNNNNNNTKIIKSSSNVFLKRGDYVVVRVDDANARTLNVSPIARTTLKEWKNFKCKNM
eukprot:GSMAST32.ASY1.ANO1.335.1 assembled CDS